MGGLLMLAWPHRMDVQRPQPGQDAAGGTVVTWVAVASAVRCQIDTMGGGLQDRFGGTGTPNNATVLTPYAGIQNGYRVRLYYRGAALGYYRVTGGTQDTLETSGIIPTFYTWTVERWESST